jgi:hypothetical protein
MINWIKNNKKAGERVLGFYWMIIFVLITIGVVSAAVLFYGNPLDVRGVEARILSDKIVECISNNGALNEATLSALNEDGSNLQDICNLNFADQAYSENQYYAELNIDGVKKIIFKKDGSEEFKVFCKEDSRKVPQCSNQEIYLLRNNNLQKVEILTAISKINQNANA